MKKYEIHPIAAAYPSISDADMKLMIKSVQKVGLLEPISLYEGKILDGRHRYKACDIAEIEPEFVEYTGDDPFGFVEAKNDRRRHMTTSQSAATAATLATLRHGGDRANHGDEIGQERAAEMMGVSPRSVSRAANVKKKAPKVFKQVLQGKTSLAEASKQVEKKTEEAAPAQLLDETGFPIPPNLYPLWARRNEVREMMALVSKVRNRLTEFQEVKDELFDIVNTSSAVERLNFAHMEIRAAELYAVCPSCGGRNCKNCAHCKRRGFLSKHVWELVPADLKKIRAQA